MDTLGWQVGAFLVGFSSLVVAIFIAKLLNNLNKTVENVNRIFIYNERYINQTVENISCATKDAKDILNTINKISSIFNIFRFIKR